jgi:kumamolisin
MTRRLLSLAIIIAVALNIAIAQLASSASAGKLASFTTLAQARATQRGFTPAQLRTAYNIDPLAAQGIDGSGQTIALIELDTYYGADIDQFDAENDLPAAQISEVYQGGTQFRLPVAGETTMDLEWAHAIAPAAKLRVYYLRSQQVNAASWRAMGGAVDAAVASGAGTISISLGTCAAGKNSVSLQQALARAMARGVTTFVSSGDDGAYPGTIKDCGKQFGVGYPASDPSVVSVGGTSVALSDTNFFQDETAWNLSGGGKGKPMPRPSWQVTPNLKPGKYRYAPDVSFLADPNTGASVLFRGRWQAAGGTSLGAPAWAAIWSLERQHAQTTNLTLGAAEQLFYRLGNSSAAAQAFHDIASGSNGAYQAKPGWDAVTGWGTPDVSGMVTAIDALLHTA